MDPVALLLSEFGSSKLHLAVVGLGAVGGVFGAALLDGIAGDERIKVSFLVTDRHVAPLGQKGLCLQSGQGMHVYRPHSIASSPKGLLSPVQIVFWAVKGETLENVLRFWRPALADNGWAVSFLNGVDNGTIMSENLPGLSIVDGCVYVGAHMKAPGQVIWEGGPRRILIGCTAAKKMNLDALCELFRRGGVDAQALPQIAPAIWEKFSFVSAVAVATSLFSCSLTDLLKETQRLSVFRGLTREISSLAQAEGQHSAQITPQQAVEKLKLFDDKTTSSLFRDLQKGRKGEFDVLVEGVIQKAHKHGLNLPLYQRCRDELRRRYF